MNQRIAHLDALRGIAIAMVVAFHYLGRWPELYPYGDAYTGSWLFSNRYAGVQLFFMVSGYVIFMTLDRCRSMREFLWRRWLRLFPALLVCSLAILVTAGLFTGRPGGAPSWSALVPTLLFVEPEWFAAAGFPTGDIEGAFWSLCVEFRYYLLAAGLFAMVGRNRLIPCLVALACLAKLGPTVAGMAFGSVAAKDITYFVLDEALVGRHLPWFCIGMLVYAWRDLPRSIAAGMAAASVVLALAPTAAAPVALGLSMAIISAFTLPFFSRPLAALLANPLLLWLGFISYPLYLLHENAGVALIAKLGRFIDTAGQGWVLALVAAAFLAAVAHVVARFIEPPLQRGLRSALAT